MIVHDPCHGWGGGRGSVPATMTMIAPEGRVVQLGGAFRSNLSPGKAGNGCRLGHIMVRLPARSLVLGVVVVTTAAI